MNVNRKWITIGIFNSPKVGRKKSRKRIATCYHEYTKKCRKQGWRLWISWESPLWFLNAACMTLILGRPRACFSGLLTFKKPWIHWLTFHFLRDNQKVPLLASTVAFNASIVLISTVVLSFRTLDRLQRLWALIHLINPEGERSEEVEI